MYKQRHRRHCSGTYRRMTRKALLGNMYQNSLRWRNCGKEPFARRLPRAKFAVCSAYCTAYLISNCWRTARAGFFSVLIRSMLINHPSVRCSSFPKDRQSCQNTNLWGCVKAIILSQFATCTIYLRAQECKCQISYCIWVRSPVRCVLLGYPLADTKTLLQLEPASAY